MIFELGESTNTGGNRRMRTAAVIAALLFGVVAVFVVYDLQTRPKPAKPFLLSFTVADVASMEAEGVYVRTEQESKTFEVGSSYWQAILDALRPAHEDDRPTKWEVFGDLTVKKKDGSAYSVMFSFDGRFATGPTLKRAYYRGGDGVALERAINGAYKASQKKK